MGLFLEHCYLIIYDPKIHLWVYLYIDGKLFIWSTTRVKKKYLKVCGIYFSL